MEQLTTDDLKRGLKFVVKTAYGVKYVIGEDGITVIDPFCGGKSHHQADKVVIILARIGSWFHAALLKNGAREPFLSNCITVVSIESA